MEEERLESLTAADAVEVGLDGAQGPPSPRALAKLAIYEKERDRERNFERRRWSYFLAFPDAEASRAFFPTTLAFFRASDSFSDAL